MKATIAATTTTAAVTAAIDAMKKKINWKGLLLGAVYMLVCFFGGYLLGMMADSGEKDLPPEVFYTNLALILLSVYGWLVLHIVIHEAGHLVFGLLTGYKFSSFRVFSLMLILDNGKLRLKKFSIPGTGGQCLMCPPDLVDGKIPTFLYNMGGCILNTQTAIVCVVMNVVFPHFFWVIGAVFGVIAVALNGIPRSKGVSNDGNNALSLRKDPKAMRAFWAQMKLAEAMSKGIRLRDMPEGWFWVPTDEQMNNVALGAMGYATCCRLLDAQKLDEFKTLADRFLSMETGLMGIQKDSLACDRITCELIGDGSREVVERLLTDQLRKTMKAMKTSISILRTEYAIALLYDKDEAKAGKHLAAFEKRAKTYPYTGDVESERDLIAMIQAKAQNQ